MEGLDPGSPRTSPSSCPRGLDVRRLSTRADSAYSSFSADPGGPEPLLPLPGSHPLPGLAWDHKESPPQGPGAPGSLSRQATPLLFALAAEAAAAAAARAAEPPSLPEPPSPPAARAAYRLRLQGAQRRVLRATSFQRKELRMSLPARPRTALSHPGEDVEPPRGTLTPGLTGSGRQTNLPRKWRFSDPQPEPELQPGEPGRVPPGDPRMLARPKPQLLQPRVLAKLGGHGIREPPEDPRRPEAPEPGSLKPAHAYRSSSGPRSASCEVMPSVQATPQGAEPSRPVFHAKLSSIRASDQLLGVALDQRDDQAPVSPERSLPKCLETSVACDCRLELSSPGAARPACRSPSVMVNGDSPPTDHIGPLATGFPKAVECDPLKDSPDDALGTQGSGAPGLHDHIAPGWGMAQPGSGARLEELIQELARLDPSLSDTLDSLPSPPAIPLTVLHGLVPIAEVWAAMRPSSGEAGEGPTASEAGSYLFSSTSLLSTSQEETRPVSLTTQPVPDQSCGQGFPEPKHLIQAKKVELAELLQKMLGDLEAEREQLQRAAQAWARRRAALEDAIGQACAPRELERFRRFLSDLERVLGLLLLLGSRLSRVHRALARLGADGDVEELASLRQRLGLLQRQQEDARELREHVARREQTLHEVLARALPAQELRSYRALLAGKAAVLAQQRGLDEWARLLQEQLDAVRSALGQSPLAPGPRPGTASPLPPSLC
ncbi:protein Shroom1 [Sorex fumeus]|uniref:protein Shroom1 n=1 Tax=Sorex fumeus TaxID=62283 RepID=UPI0024ACFA8D|nr:protein Shroom1 [Sorex fumeus]